MTDPTASLLILYITLILNFEPGSEQDASAHHDYVDTFGGQLLGRSAGVAGTGCASAGAGDVRVHMPVTDVDVSGCGREVLHNARAPNRQLCVGHTEYASEPCGVGRRSVVTARRCVIRATAG